MRSPIKCARCSQIDQLIHDFVNFFAVRKAYTNKVRNVSTLGGEIMKRVGFMLMGMTLMFSLVACGSDGNSAAEQTSAANPTELEIIATNFDFDQEEYRVKVGEPVEFSIVNEDGTHGYEVEGLGIKIGPNEVKQYTINKAGEYTIACNIWCGTGHDQMKSKLIVEE